MHLDFCTKVEMASTCLWSQANIQQQTIETIVKAIPLKRWGVGMTVPNIKETNIHVYAARHAYSPDIL